MTDAEFWQSTPYLTRLCVEAAGERERHAYRRAMFGSWHAGAFQRIKRMPTLEKALGGFERKGRPKRMSADEMLRVIEQWNVAFGGADLRKGKGGEVGLVS